MRTKNVGINIRVDEKEKRNLERKAKKSGLSLSAYLRKVGLEKEIYPIPDKEFYKVYIDKCFQNIKYWLQHILIQEHIIIIL